MREILFRAKRTDNGEWVEGQYAYILNPLTESGEPIKHMICNGTNIFNYEINQETLCQYTGLKDKNDNRIWENDIVGCLFFSKIIYGTIKFGMSKKQCVDETSGEWGFYIEWEEKENSLRENMGCWIKEIECAGNIFDNPELLKGEENKPGDEI